MTGNVWELELKNAAFDQRFNMRSAKERPVLGTKRIGKVVDPLWHGAQLHNLPFKSFTGIRRRSRKHGLGSGLRDLVLATDVREEPSLVLCKRDAEATLEEDLLFGQQQFPKHGHFECPLLLVVSDSGRHIAE